MANPQQVTDEELTDLHKRGMSARKMADKLGVAPSTISRRCKKLGLKFDRQQTVNATHAKQIDLHSKRLALADRMLDRANRTLDEVEHEVVVYNFGGKENTFEEKTLDKAPTSMVREAMTTAAIAFDKATRIVEKEAPNSQVEAANMLSSLAEAFGIKQPGE